MARVLHLLKSSDPTPALDVIAQQQAAGDEITVALLSGAPAPALPSGVRVQRVPDELGWETLLERIFEADQVITW
jgi:hypothetical protein